LIDRTRTATTIALATGAMLLGSAGCETDDNNDDDWYDNDVISRQPYRSSETGIVVDDDIERNDNIQRERQNEQLDDINGIDRTFDSPNPPDPRDDNFSDRDTLRGGSGGVGGVDETGPPR
jgi:hypothetical protein